MEFQTGNDLLHILSQLCHMSKENVLVTGGCGFIGSHLSQELISDYSVYIADDMSAGKQRYAPDGSQKVFNSDLTESSAVERIINEVNPVKVYHLAASSDVRSDSVGTGQFEYNTKITNNLVTHAHKNGCPDFIFTSSSTVYGWTDVIPTGESHHLNPNSYYGSGKIGSESILRTYSSQTSAEVKIFRLANIVGPRLRGAVIPDFVLKLRDNPEELEILGDGRQKKSYMHVDECVEAILHVDSSYDSGIIVNVGTDSTTTVTRIADIVSNVMNLNPEYNYTGGRQGWTGDVPEVRLDISRLESLGYTPRLSSDESVRKATEQLVKEL